MNQKTDILKPDFDVNQSPLSPTDQKEVDELCHILARVLVRVAASEQKSVMKGKAA